MSWLTRLCLLALAILPIVALGARDALATLPDGADVRFVEKTTILLQKPGETDDDFEGLSAEETRRAFNLAHCQCSDANSNFTEGQFGFDIDVSKDTADGISGEFWSGLAGADCTTSENQQSNSTSCRKTSTTIPDFDDLVGETREFRIRTSEFLKVTEATCPTNRTGTLRLYILGPSVEGGRFDYGVFNEIPVDTEPPPLPADIEASAVEGQVNLSWDINVDDADDIEYFQAFCAKADGTPVRTRASLKRRFDTAKSLCSLASSSDLVLEPKAAPSEDGTPVTSERLPADFLTNPLYLCAETGTGGGMEIEGLRNDAEYIIGVVAVDFYGNGRGFYLTSTQVPVEVTDFWEDLKGRDSQVEGGFCLVAETYGDRGGPTQALRAFRDETLASTALGRWLIAAYYEHTSGLGAAIHGSTALRIVFAIALLPAVAVALLWHVLTLPGLLLLVALGIAARRWLRRTAHRRFALTATAAALALAPSLASAQSFAPYWEEEEAALSEPDTGSRWHVGIKIGPYTPAIDDQFQDQTGSTQEPFDEAFRGGMWLPVLEIDWFLLNEMGQLGFGGSVGFTGDGANPWAPDSSPGASDRVRVPGEDMTFRLVPLTATVVYRATQLDDFYGIPLVPYARAGLGYYVWWMNSPNGDRSRTDDGCSGRGCRGSGASLGLVGSVGLAVRAERIDNNAALSMRESGIDHAGFYIEGQYGWVDGFGSDEKLAVGALTWFAGINFEF